MNSTIKKYLASIGRKGGSRNTPAQQEARKAKRPNAGRPRKPDHEIQPASLKRREYRAKIAANN